jgi:hypothetical protein
MITGITQHIYPQKNCFFNIFWFNSENNWSGSFNLINSGNDDFGIDFNSGKIYQNNNFIYSIAPQRYINLSGNFSKNFFNLFIDNNFLYSKSGNFENISGFSLDWTTGYSWDSPDLFPEIYFYGESPVIDFIYPSSGVISDSISVNISGNIKNNGPFEIYSGSIGAYENNPQSFYFAISGVENWKSGIKINNGSIFNITIVPTNTRLTNRNTYIPLVLKTNAGDIGENLFVNRYNASPVQSLSSTINNSISISNIDSLSQSSHVFNLKFNNTEALTNKATVTISGYFGNDISQNGYQDTFSGSWSLIIDNQNIPFDSGKNIFIGEIDIGPNVFQQTKIFEVYKKIQRANGDIGFTGSAIYNISGNNFLQSGILGSNINIFREYYAFNI